MRSFAGSAATACSLRGVNSSPLSSSSSRGRTKRQVGVRHWDPLMFGVMCDSSGFIRMRNGLIPGVAWKSGEDGPESSRTQEKVCSTNGISVVVYPTTPIGCQPNWEKEGCTWFNEVQAIRLVLLCNNPIDWLVGLKLHPTTRVHLCPATPVLDFLA